ITGSIDYYAKEATDLYASVPVDYTVGLGYAAITMNSANMRGKGLDVELNSLNIDRQFKWHTVLNFNYYKDKVIEYYPLSTSGNYYTRDTRLPREDYPVWAVYAYPWAGLDAMG